MIKKTIGLGLLSLSCSLPVMAGTMGEDVTHTIPAVYMGAYGGYGKIDGAIKSDGNFSQARLSLGAYAPKSYRNISLGGELGVQLGNTMRLSADPDVLELSGGLPIQSTLKPLIDALVTLKYRYEPSCPLDVILKGGIAYRQLQLNDRTSIQDSLSKVNGEFQAGLGYQLTEHAQLTAMYQGIYSKSNANVKYTSVEVNDFFDIGYTTISQIPTQQAGFLGIEYTF